MMELAMLMLGLQYIFRFLYAAFAVAPKHGATQKSCKYLARRGQEK